MPIPDPPVVYQLRMRLDAISPLIWRRLLVTGTTGISGTLTSSARCRSSSMSDGSSKIRMRR